MPENFNDGLSRADFDDLEAAGMTPQAIEDAIATLRVRGAESFTAHEVLAIGPVRKDVLSKLRDTSHEPLDSSESESR